MNVISNLIDLIYEEHQNLLPFLDVLRKDIAKLEFKRNGAKETADISLQNNKFYIVVNIDFIEEYKLNNEDILWLVCHEISHFILGHLNAGFFEKYPKQFCNIAFDCQVNSMLYNINQRERINLFVKTHHVNYLQFINGETEEMYFLTVPPEVEENSEEENFSKIIVDKEKLKIISEFRFKNFSEAGLGLDDIFSYLKKILPEEKETPEEEQNEDNKTTIESKENRQISVDELPEYSKNLLLNQSKEISEIVKDFSENSFTEINIDRQFNLDNVDLEHRKQVMLSDAIKNALFNGKDAKTTADESTRFNSVFPKIGRKEAVIISSGIIPTFYADTFKVPTKKTLAIYIDFSTSTMPFHKEICKLLTPIKNLYNGRYFAFSMRVKEITSNDLLYGSFESSGTYITPVVNHINENHFKKVLIITDGEFMNPNSKTKAEIFAVLFNKTNKTGSLMKTGRVKKIWYIN